MDLEMVTTQLYSKTRYRASNGETAWHSPDGVNWTEEQTSRSSISMESFEVINDQLWIIGTNEIGNSADGFTWNVVLRRIPLRVPS